MHNQEISVRSHAQVVFQLFSQLCFLALAPYLNPSRASRDGYTQFNDYGHGGGGGGGQHLAHAPPHHATPYAGGTNHGLGDAYGQAVPHPSHGELAVPLRHEPSLDYEGGGGGGGGHGDLHLPQEAPPGYSGHHGYGELDPSAHDDYPVAAGFPPFHTDYSRIKKKGEQVRDDQVPSASPAPDADTGGAPKKVDEPFLNSVREDSGEESRFLFKIPPWHSPRSRFQWQKNAAENHACRQGY